MAPTLYKSALALIAFAIVAAGLCDLGLYLTGQQTISAWLRMNPAWFAGALAVSTAFVVGLTIHLFG